MAPTIDIAAGLLGRLVACPSVNPGPHPPRIIEPPFGEGAMGDLLSDLVREWGGRPRKVAFAPGRWNFVAEFPGETAERSLLLEAHADTVTVAGMTIPPFEPVRRDGRMYGRGSCDNKGPMAALLLGLRTVFEERGRPPATVHFVATGDEERGGGGARYLAASGAHYDGAVVAEPTEMRIVHAHKGAYRCRIATRGQAAHSSDPSRGRNAIRAMVRVVEAIEGPLAARLATRTHPAFGGPTVSVGTIHGGEQANVVPDRCIIEVDRRTLPGENAASVTEEFREMLEALRAADATFRYEIEETEWYPAFEEAPTSPIVRTAAAACQAVLGRAELTAVPWAANAGIFQEAGIPCVLIGPGSIRQAHTADESIDLEEVVRAAEVYAEIIRRF